MEYFDKVFKHFERDGRIHASFKIDDKIYSFEKDSMDMISMVIWDSEEEYLENFEEMSE